MKKSTIPILYRDTSCSPTDPCPFCGKRHQHGNTDGYRVAHCVLKSHSNNDAYILKTRYPDEVDLDPLMRN